MSGWSAARPLAGLAEAYMRDGFVDEEAVRAEIAPCFIERDGKRTDIVVLACTHYPFLANLYAQDWRPGRSTGSIRPRRSPGGRCRCCTQTRAPIELGR